MSVTVSLRNLRYSPRKLVAITSLFQKKPLISSMNKAKLMPNKSALYVYKLLKMAESAAKERSLLPENMLITQIYANEGPRMKRMRPTAKGRPSRYVKQLSHLTIIIDEQTATNSAKSIKTQKGTDGSKSQSNQ